MTLLYSGGEKREQCFAIKVNILPNIVDFKPVRDRIYYIELKCKWYVFLINCYAPTEDKSDNIKNDRK